MSGLKVKLARGLYGPDHADGPSVGPDVVAVKRAVARGFTSLYGWADFDQTYNRRLVAAVRTIQKSHGIVATGNYGAETHALLTATRRAGVSTQWAFDAVAINLMEGEWEELHKPPPTPPDVLVRAAMVDFMDRALVNAGRWHYSQRRPMQFLGVSPDLTHFNDCSEGVTEVYMWARLATGVLVPDPNGRGFDGWGNTDTQWAHGSSHRVSGFYDVGDLALYTAHHGHVTICLEAGNDDTAVFWSNGSERAPNTTRLRYRTDLRGVVRPGLVP